MIDVPLPKHMVGSRLGQLKLEYEIKRAISLAPKVYGLITFDDKEIIKVKGITKASLKYITLRDLEQLLLKDTYKQFTQEKWYKKVFEGSITVSEVAYQLKVTSNKRKLVYNEYDMFCDTEPYFYNSIELISN